MKEQSVFEKVFGSEDTREIQLFRNEELDLQMRTVLNEDGSISVNAEDTAIGFGWVTVAKSGNEVIRWQRFNDYCRELGFPTQVRKETYIPESLYYLLAMKANNRRSQKFQRWLAMEVIPEIRKTGSYGKTEQTVTITEPMENPELLIRAVEAMSGCLEGNRPYVLNILRHIIPDIDENIGKKETKIESMIVTQNKVFYKQGIKINKAKLKDEIIKNNLTMGKLSSKAGVAYNTVSNTVNGVTNPTQETLDKISKALGCDSNYLKLRERRKRSD